jgi:hypothetical protein
VDFGPACGAVGEHSDHVVGGRVAVDGDAVVGFLCGGVTGASVQIIPSVVAMFGWIMPAPLVMPAIEKVFFGEDGRVKVRDASLGNVSVVQMPLAASSQSEWDFPMLRWRVGMLLIMLAMGSLRTKSTFFAVPVGDLLTGYHPSLYA